MSNEENTEVEIINGGFRTPFRGGRKRLAAALAALNVLDKLVEHHSAFRDFTELLNAAGNYRPSLEVPNKKCGPKVAAELSRGERGIIALAYDEAQRSLQDERRASTYSPPPFKREKPYTRKLVQVKEG